ncbi:hypothetical protein L218DRAFT_511163 [Marasmius fiardii PR-910]|nr:hypothetical protein L218DRAFT_511163 [Marasmius fiardii PR-910]
MRDRLTYVDNSAYAMEFQAVDPKRGVKRMHQTSQNLSRSTSHLKSELETTREGSKALEEGLAEIPVLTSISVCATRTRALDLLSMTTVRSK